MMFPPIHAIFLAEFDSEQGPIVTFSIPEDVVAMGEHKHYTNERANPTKEDTQTSAPGALVKNTKINSNTNTGTTLDRNAPTEPHQGYNTGTMHQPVIVLSQRYHASKIMAAKSRSGHDVAGEATSGKIDFNSIQALVIPKLVLYERLITINTEHHKVMGYPVAVKGDYQRNVLIFNVCFAFSIDADTRCYEPIVKRIGNLLKELEVKGKVLSNSEAKWSLKLMMTQLLNNLNDHGEYQIDLDASGLSRSTTLPFVTSSSISIKLFPVYDNPMEVRSFHVPVRTVDIDLAKLEPTKKNLGGACDGAQDDDILWDLVIDKILPYLDNVNHVRRISQLSEIKESVVIEALKHLEYYGCVRMIDLFQFTNVYEIQQGGLARLYSSGPLQKECYKYITRDETMESAGCHGGVKLVELVQLYSTMSLRESVAGWVLRNDIDIERFDVRRFIVFGVMHQILRRVYCYPVVDGNDGICGGEDNVESGADEAPSDNGGGGADEAAMVERILPLLDGTRHMDELCVSEGKDFSTLRKWIDAHSNAEYLYL